VGATTLSAFLASLLMGFKTLAIEKRSLEVWETLRGVKKQFAEFEKMLDKAHQQLQTADRTIETIVGTRTRAINRSLRDVETLPEVDDLPAAALLGVEGEDEDPSASAGARRGEEADG
jgi:DNA recombination protein RmuC